MHLANAMVASDRGALRDRVNRLRGRDQSVENYAKIHNPGTVEDLTDLFPKHGEAGARHSLISVPDVTFADTIEIFGEVITAFESS